MLVGMRAQDGQGTIEYLAVVLLVAAVMGAAAALVVVTGLGERVTAAMRRALCVVTGEACDEARRIAVAPCVRSSREHADGGHMQVLVVRVGSRDVELRERRSDGTVAVTLVDEKDGGLDAGTGVEAHLRWGHGGFAIGSELRVALLAGRASGRTWIVPDAAAADRVVLQAALEARSHRPAVTIQPTDQYSPYMPGPAEVHAPQPDVTFHERSSGLTVDFHAGNSKALTLSTDDAYGERVDRATGRRTVYVRATGGGRGKLSFAGAGSDEQEERYGITFDRSGRPVDLEVLSTVDVSGAAGLPPRLARIAGWLKIPAYGAKHVETEQHLDLLEPANAEAADAFLRDFGDGRLGVQFTANALRERLDLDGTLNVRTYSADETAHQLGGHAKVLGVGIGGEGGSEDRSAQLVAAARRDEAGRWVADTACLPAV
jgi:hypothetical protein